MRLVYPLNAKNAVVDQGRSSHDFGQKVDIAFDLFLLIKRCPTPIVLAIGTLIQHKEFLIEKKDAILPTGFLLQGPHARISQMANLTDTSNVWETWAW